MANAIALGWGDSDGNTGYAALRIKFTPLLAI
jgi:hypothetical protein